MDFQDRSKLESHLLTKHVCSETHSSQSSALLEVQVMKGVQVSASLWSKEDRAVVETKERRRRMNIVTKDD